MIETFSVVKLVKLLFWFFIDFRQTIQSGHKGHSSAEDAKATLDLVRLKLSQCKSPNIAASQPILPAANILVTM